MPRPETTVPSPIDSQCHTLCHPTNSASTTRKMIPAVASTTSASIARVLPRVASANTTNKKQEPERRNRRRQIQKHSQCHEIANQRNAKLVSLASVRR